MVLRAPYSLQVALQADMLATLLFKLSPGDTASFLAQEVCAVELRLEKGPFSIHIVVRAASALQSSVPGLYIFCLGEVIFQTMEAIKS